MRRLIALSSRELKYTPPFPQPRKENRLSLVFLPGSSWCRVTHSLAFVCVRVAYRQPIRIDHSDLEKRTGDCPVSLTRWLTTT